MIAKKLLIGVTLRIIPCRPGFSSRSGKPPDRATRSTPYDLILGMLRCVLVLAVTVIGVAHAAAPLATESDQFMVVSAQHLAAEAGAEILRAGGNAIDAAVAIGYAEAVTNPCCGNIGGGGFLVAHLADGRDVFINFRETAPSGASPGMYLDAGGAIIPGASLHGWRAAGVPGTVLGLDTALTHYGTLPRSRVMAAAIRLARDGFILTRGDTDILAHAAPRLRQNPAIARIFLRPDGSPFEPGDRLIQANLADTLADIAANGPDVFYKGPIAAAVAGASGGALTEADFASYHVTEAKPLSCVYRGQVILSAPPPSSGGATLCEILNVLEGYDLEALGFHSAQAVHIMVEAMRNAYADRNNFLGDPEFVHNPLEQLLSREHADQISARITDRATPSSAEGPDTLPDESPQTTSYSVLDKVGNAVAVTYTLNGFFGAGVMAGDTGFLMNNEMDDFTIKPGVANNFGLVQGTANMIAPGKRPLSSMAPTIVLRDSHVSMVLGSPGGARIITIVLETILNVIDYRMSPQEAVDAPRLHHQFLPDTIYAERFALSPDTSVALEAMGYTITEQPNWGAAALIAVGPPSTAPDTQDAMPSDAAAGGRMRPGLFYGAMDSRRPAGLAIGE
jgi:gamma-glutamyltranspeptidase / glutathione hydrolase